MASLSSTTLVVILLAVLVTVVAYMSYPDTPSLEYVSQEATGKPLEAPLFDSLIVSVSHATCYRGLASISGEVVTRSGLVYLSGRPIYPAPGMWSARVGGEEYIVMHRDVFEYLRRGGVVDVKGYIARLDVPGEGPRDVLVATELSIKGAEGGAYLKWLGHFGACPSQEAPGQEVGHGGMMHGHCP